MNTTILNSPFALYDALPVEVVVLDSKLQIRYLNQRFLQTFDLQLGKVLGLHFSEIFDTYTLITQISQFHKQAELSFEMNHLLMKKRKLVPYKFQFQKFQDDTIITLTSQEHLLEKIQELEVYKDRAYAHSKMTLIGEMSKELGLEMSAPLMVILNSCNQLQREWQLSKTKAEENFGVNHQSVDRRLGKIKQSALKIKQMVDGIEALSRDHSKDPIVSSSVKDLIRAGVDLWGQKIKNQEINLIIDEIDPHLSIDCKLGQVTQVLMNLVQNSKDAIVGMENPWIKISTEDHQDFVRFNVTDSGHGINKDLESQIFRPFYTTKNNPLRTGLGLSRSKDLIESHFGSFYIDQSQKNTTFVFEIPKNLKEIMQN